MKRAYVMVATAVEEDLSLKVKSIVIYSDRASETDLSELFFEWFSVTGWSFPNAHENAVGAIAFFAKCRPKLKDAIVRACAPALRDEVVRALGE